MKLLLITILLGQIKITAYQSLKRDTDSTPFHTSTGKHVIVGGCAISRDMLCGACRKKHRRCDHPDYTKKLHYGDDLYINGHGLVKINDVMGEYTRVRINGKIKRFPITKQIDIWVENKPEESKVFKQYRNGFTEVWKVVKENG